MHKTGLVFSITTASFLAIWGVASACLNEYEPTFEFSTTALDRSTTTVRSKLPPWLVFESQFLRTHSQDRLETSRRRMLERGSKDLHAMNDLAVAQIRMGDASSALGVLNEIEAEKPGEYFTAANLGVAYELSGDLDKALFWVKTGIERSPSSHRGTEWLHVRILEIRREQTTNGRLLSQGSVLGLDFGTDRNPAEPSPEALDRLYSGLTLPSLATALEHQLTERTSLVPPRNDVVADLFFDLANVMALNGKVEHAVVSMKLARAYGPPTRPDFELREKRFAEVATFTIPADAQLHANKVAKEKEDDDRHKFGPEVPVWFMEVPVWFMVESAGAILFVGASLTWLCSRIWSRHRPPIASARELEHHDAALVSATDSPPNVIDNGDSNSNHGSAE